MASPNNSPSKKQPQSSMAIAGNTLGNEHKFLETKAPPFVLNQDALYVCQLLAINPDDLVLR
jgi:hypothetical protein